MTIFLFSVLVREYSFSKDKYDKQINPYSTIPTTKRHQHTSTINIYLIIICTFIKRGRPHTLSLEE